MTRVRTQSVPRRLLPLVTLAIGACTGADNFERDVAEYLQRFPYQDTYNYVMRYTGGDPAKLNVWVLGAEPALTKAGEDKVVRMNNDTSTTRRRSPMPTGRSRLYSSRHAGVMARTASLYRRARSTCSRGTTCLTRRSLADSGRCPIPRCSSDGHASERSRRALRRSASYARSSAASTPSPTRRADSMSRVSSSLAPTPA